MAATMYLQNLLQYCARNCLIVEGKACHAQIIRAGLGVDTLTSNMLINMYCKCGLLHPARQVFDKMPERSLVSWNTMIGAHTQNGRADDALSLFVRMQREESPLSEFTVSSVLCACAAKSAIFECRQLHAFAVKKGIESNVYVGTALIDVYSKCNFMGEASWVFESLEEKSDVTWSSMVAGYVRNELYEEALRLYHRGQAVGLEQNQFTLSSVFSACTGLGALTEGNQVNATLFKSGFGASVFVASSLVDMYAKCGAIKEAYTVFSDQYSKNVVSWNAMISGFSRHGRCLEAMILFEKMQQTGLYPNEVTYLSVLSACGHMGLVKEGQKYFDLMVREHNISQSVLHYSCLVDIFGRAGYIQDAYDVIKAMPFEATASMWGSLLASCRNFKNLELAEIAAKHLFELEPTNAGNHVLLSNIYAANKNWEKVAKSRQLLKESEAVKDLGKSWIEIKGKVHSFMVGEREHPQIAEIYLKLDKLMEEMEKLGYKVEMAHDHHDVDDSNKEMLLRHHSEKLAFTFGVISQPPGAPIRIMKNLRICGDCHNFMRFASIITKREIIVRDLNRFHHFSNGCCSCGDFW
ncbi:pentatricopeptide repeat-containing protein At5g04780-like [Chenopodium quinoa]|uniref:pentatricopeptide repeat-containing protein At5g04780-like n=1 Tax=Chenopodium quinoa TaxID=63459 RepID=UPI000B76BF94|nr:pentatricopeptide repeat-containing protein At5g04780-like [Chenopodium quinoa]XP_021774580.1 pentatricopeptide repeat-containing protein At5g04780-like [Chenopodium quinoa]XP_021774581.1 pentatricopeptide repeat-containing protein At5g04780-like [Chenopodium quinoa]XP_021774582.1 pentatricopeptide repeat-containing protein At5g04780-like [Chenopodium quinoa]